MLWYRPGDTLRIEFPTSSPANGQSTAADSTPVCSLVRNGTIDAAVTVAVASIETGRYSASCTIPGGYAAGDLIAVRVTATVSGVTGRDTLLETRLIAIDLTVAIASQLFVDGGTNKLKVNADHSVNGEVVLSPESLAAISASINASTLTANQIAAALADTTSVVLVGPLMNGPAHLMVRGSAYLHSLTTAPYVRVAKAMYNLAGATATFRIKLDRQTAVVVAATIMSYDSNYYEIYADIAEADTVAVTPGIGSDQFWATLSSGKEVALSRTFLEVIEGIGVV